MSEPKISIIVPVYNAEKYLKESLESLLNQTFKDIEILCINDGSKDSSGDILNAFREKDSRIKVFHQDNSGPATARNVGLRAAMGQYLMFCDADDRYEPDMCAQMYEAITQNDVDFAMCDSNIIVEDENHGRDIKSMKYHYIRDFGFVPLTDWKRLKINVLLWNKIFKMDLIKQYQLSFPDGYESDDNAFIYAYLSISKTFWGVQKKLYNYRLLNNSIMGKIFAQKKTEKLYDRIYAIRHFVEFLKRNDLIKGNMFLIQQIQNSISFVFSQLPNEEKVKFLTLMTREVLSDPAVAEIVHSAEKEYPLLAVCLAGNYKKAVSLQKHHHGFFKKVFGSVEKNGKKRYYFLGLPIFKKVKTKTEKKYYLLGFKVYKKKRKVKEYDQTTEEEIPDIPNADRPYILCFDCLYDKEQEAIDAWTFFNYLQDHQIPSKYVLLTGNRLASQVQGRKDVILIKKQEDFCKVCGSIIQQSKYVVTSFGLKRSIEKCFNKQKGLKYLYIGHGVALLKKGVFNLYNPERFDRLLSATRLTYELYKEKGWNVSNLFCAGMPRWDLLTQKENNGHIFVFFTWRNSFSIQQNAIDKYVLRIVQLLKKIRQALPNTPIDIALHHECLRKGVVAPNLESLNINLIPTSEVSRAIRTAGLLITDYSSVCWDFMYMDKPLIFYRFDSDDISLVQSDQEATLSAMEEDRKLYNCLYKEQEVLDKVVQYVQNQFQIEPEIKEKNKNIFWPDRNNCANLYNLIQGKK